MVVVGGSKIKNTTKHINLPTDSPSVPIKN
jgi:hypothetical protein